MGAQTSSASAVTADLQNTATLTTNVQQAGTSTNLASASVSQASAQQQPTIAAASLGNSGEASDGISGGAIEGIAVAVLVVIALVAGLAFFMMRGPKASGSASS